MPHIFVNRPCDRNVLCLDPIFAPPWIPPLLEAVSAGEKNLRRVHFPLSHSHLPSKRRLGADLGKF